MTSTDWRLHAACRDFPINRIDDVFFSTSKDGIAEAKKICKRCPVIIDCREAGRREPFGVWGGLSEDERGGTKHFDLTWRTCGACDSSMPPLDGRHLYCSDRCKDKAAVAAEKMREQRRNLKNRQRKGA